MKLCALSVMPPPVLRILPSILFCACVVSTAAADTTYEDNVGRIIESVAENGKRHQADDWGEVAAELGKLSKSLYESSNLATEVDYLVSRLGVSAVSNVCIALAAPDMFLLRRTSSPYALLDLSSVSSSGARHLKEKARVEHLVTQSLVRRFWKNPHILRQYTVLSYWIYLLGSPDRHIHEQIARLDDRAATVAGNFPKRGDSGFHWYAREALTLICISGRSDLLTGRSLGASREVFQLWYEWWRGEIAKLTEMSDLDNFERLLNTKRLRDEVEASGYSQLWEGLPLFLLALGDQ